jgi:hypothetical protein
MPARQSFGIKIVFISKGLGGDLERDEFDRMW